MPCDEVAVRVVTSVQRRYHRQQLWQQRPYAYDETTYADDVTCGNALPCVRDNGGVRSVTCVQHILCVPCVQHGELGNGDGPCLTYETCMSRRTWSPARLEVEHLTHLACRAGNTMASSANGSPGTGGPVSYLEAEINRFRFVRTNMLKLALHAQVEVMRRHSVAEPSSANRLKYAMALTSLPDIDDSESDRSSSPVPVDSPELATGGGEGNTVHLQVQLPPPPSMIGTPSNSKRSSDVASTISNSSSTGTHVRSSSMESGASTPYTPFGSSNTGSIAGSPLSVDVFTPHASSSFFLSSSLVSPYAVPPSLPTLDLDAECLGSPAPSTRSFGFGWTCTSACSNKVHLHGNTRKTRRRATL